MVAHLGNGKQDLHVVPALHVEALTPSLIST